MPDDWYNKLPTERKEELKERFRQRYKNLTPEQLAQVKENNKQRHHRFLASLTPEQLIEHKRKTREKWERYKQNLTPEKILELRERRRRNARAKYAVLPTDKKEQFKETLRQRYKNMTLEDHRKDNERTSILRRERKRQVLSHYSNGEPKCCRCGFSDIRALSMDHVNGGGREHIRQINKTRLYDWLLNNNFPEGYQVLCMNCQFIKKIENKEDKPANKKY